ncbi:MAG: esterase family protein [Chloroflexi bacterium]|nr:esterase family protein [Chloroflexota bacterium]
MTKIHPLLERARADGNPVVEGSRVTFLWEGKSAPRLIDDMHGWEDKPQKLKRLAPGLWGISFELPRDTYLEYAFYDPRSETRFPDPLNPNSVYNGAGSYNHFVYMPEAAPTPLAAKRKGVPRGKVTHHRVETWMLADDGERDIYFYRPPVKEPVPLLIVYDGMDYLERAQLNVIVDNLIAEKRIRPIAMAFLQNGGDQRGVEYACSDATIMWLDHVILPLARKRLNLLDVKENRGAYGVLGASFGGLMSMYTGLRMPEIFGKVIAQSAVFESEGRDFAAVDLIKHEQARELKIWMDIGRFDELLEDNRRMQPILREHGCDVTYREFTGGHCCTAWRDDVWRGLEAMFFAESEVS